MRTIAAAEELARTQHITQVDKAGRPYVEHLARVARASEGRTTRARSAGLQIDVDSVVQAAWLHDLLEDTQVSADSLRTLDFAPSVIEMVELLTKPSAPVVPPSYEARIE